MSSMNRRRFMILPPFLCDEELYYMPWATTRLTVLIRRRDNAFARAQSH